MTHYTALNQDHVLGPARNINLNDLHTHLILDHGVNTTRYKTKGELGKLHLMVHTILAYPGWAVILDLPEGYGTGKHIPEKH